MFQSIIEKVSESSSATHKLRENYHKKIRKQALDKKLSSMRKSLFMGILHEQVQEGMKQEGNFLQNFDQKYRTRLLQQVNKQGQSESMRTIVKSLSILSKFSKLGLQSMGSSQISRYVKKIDAIICLLMNIDEWIMEDDARKDIETELKLRQEKEFKEQNYDEDESLKRLEQLRPIKWIQQDSCKSKMEILRELVNIMLFGKVADYFQTILLQTSKTFNKISHTIPTLISPILAKWLFFYQANMKMFYQSSNSRFKQTLQQQHLDLYWQTIYSYYFQILSNAFKMIKIPTIIQVIFNVVDDVLWFHDELIDKEKTELYSRYITCSPFQYLLGNNGGEGQKLLRYLQRQMQAQIQVMEKYHVIQKLRSLSLNEQNIELINSLQERQIELQKAKRILSSMTKKLDHNRL